MNENERPELGTTEAAVRSCVNLIALATHTDEEHLAYWLDLYYQVRSRHEKEMTPLDFSDLLVKVEEPDPVMVKLGELEAGMSSMTELVRAFIEQFTEKDGEPSETPAPREDINEKLAEGFGAAVKGGLAEATADGPLISEAAAAQKKNRAPLTTGERRKLQNAEKEKKRILGRGDWREFKRATFARLQEAKAGGLTIGAIVAASEGKLTENTVLDILNAAPRPIEDYRALDAALDECAKQ